MEEIIKTVKDVQDGIDKIKSTMDDPEGAHSYEDELWRNVLASIASGEAENPKEMALLALSTQTLDFPRWYA